MLRLGIDIGGTKLEAVLLAPDGLVMSRKRIPTEASLGYRHIINRIGVLANEVLRGTDSFSYTVGVGTPGSISPETSLLRNSNTICLNEKPLKDLIENELNCPIILENDANCFALAEALLGAGKNYSNVFGIILGTGCGAGIVLRGRRLLGKNLIAGEWGHHSIDLNGRKCWCGKKGCLETYLSGSGVENQYRAKTGEELTAEEIFESNTIAATEIRRTFYEAFGRGVANVCNILDPDVIVVGGGLSNRPELYNFGVDAVKKYIFTDNYKTNIVKNALGDSAGVFGAAMLGENLIF